MPECGSHYPVLAIERRAAVDIRATASVLLQGLLAKNKILW